MRIEILDQLRLSSQVDMFSLLMKEQYLENYPNKICITHSTMESAFIALDKAGEKIN